MSSVYVAGHYLKLRRMLSHSPWDVNGVRMGVGSVEEKLSVHIVPLFGRGCTSRFYSAGREDIDVRMLGGGRPFSFEIVDPKRLPEAKELEDAAEKIRNEGEGEVEALKLRLVNKVQMITMNNRDMVMII